jgi:hypothetical protein
VDPQLQAIVADLGLAHERLRMLHASVPRQVWHHRPGAACWSPAECLAHLNLTSEACLPLLRAALQQARDRGGRTASPYRRDLIGWLLWKMVTPSGGWKTATIPPFVPAAGRPPEHLVRDFEQLQSDLVSCVRDAENLPIDRVTLASPFAPRVKFNLYAALTLIPRHQHRHLLQAERAAQGCAPLVSALAV